MNLSCVCISTCDGIDEVCYLQNPSSQILECVFFLDVHFRDLFLQGTLQYLQKNSFSRSKCQKTDPIILAKQ